MAIASRARWWTAEQMAKAKLGWCGSGKVAAEVVFVRVNTALFFSNGVNRITVPKILLRIAADSLNCSVGPVSFDQNPCRTVSVSCCTSEQHTYRNRDSGLAYRTYGIIGNRLGVYRWFFFWGREGTSETCTHNAHLVHITTYAHTCTSSITHVRNLLYSTRTPCSAGTHFFTEYVRMCVP